MKTKSDRLGIPEEEDREQARRNSVQLERLSDLESCLSRLCDSPNFGIT